MTNYYDKDGERKIPYKEDSTKGRSNISPLNYKGDVLTQAWIDSRILASLGLWLEKNGFSPKSLADIARKPLEILIEFLVEKGQATMIDNTAEARAYLRRRFKTSLNRGGRGLKNVLHNNVLTDKREELADRISQGQRFNDSEVPSVDKPDSEIDKLVNIYNNLENKETESSIHEGASLEELEAHVAKEDEERIAAENDPKTLEYLKSHTVEEEE